MEFLLQLPKILDLTDDDKCPVCLEQYAPSKAPAPRIIGRFFSMAVRRKSAPIDSQLECAVQLLTQPSCAWHSMYQALGLPVEGGQSTCLYVSALAKFLLT